MAATTMVEEKAPLKYKRVLLKIGGEALCGPGKTGIDKTSLQGLATEIKDVVELGAQICLVIGGANIARGSTLARDTGIDEATAHYIGMLATIINAIAVQDVLEKHGVDTRVQSAIAIDRVCEQFVRRRAIRHLEKKRVVIFAAGTGNPYVTTDTGAALRAAEVRADVLIKATKVEGVYTRDPAKDPHAKLLERLTYEEAIEKRLEVMDVSAFDLCQRNRIPIVVCAWQRHGTVRAIVEGAGKGTLIDGGGSRP